jgi:hypothetical protein
MSDKTSLRTAIEVGIALLWRVAADPELTPREVAELAELLDRTADEIRDANAIGDRVTHS